MIYSQSNTNPHISYDFAICDLPQGKCTLLYTSIHWKSNSYLTNGKLMFLLKFLMANMFGLMDRWGVLMLDEFALI